MPPEHGPSSSQCPQCSATSADYTDQRHFADAEPFQLKLCPSCGRTKCSCCDMGDDVPCIGCEQEE